MRYFIGFLVTILLIILVIFLLVRGGGKPKVTTTAKTLDSYATTNAEVRLTIDGPVNADQIHNQVRISVDRDNSTFEHIKGYQGNTVKMQRYPNNQAAYATFLLALAHVGFTKGNPDPALRDERGYCPTENRYIFELRQDERDIERYWATGCGNPKTYLGNVGLTLDLFRAQIPDYATLTQDAEL
jgi:hypothetical protein